MATHAVPQDVEADDKLIGFLSLKQFIFTIIGLGFGYLTFFFFTRVHPISAVIWVPFTMFFLVLGLYQRKDQPAEVFLASALGFYLKPKVRIWSQDGYEERVMITAPPIVEKHYTKDFTGEEAMGRLSRLSLMMDSRGWASKRTDDWQNPALAASAESNRLIGMHDVATTQGVDVSRYNQPVDPYDDASMVGQSFDQQITQNTNAIKEEAFRSTLQAAQQSQNVSPITPQPAPEIATSSPPVAIAPSPVPTTQEEQAAAAFLQTQKQNDIPSIREKVVAPLPEEPAAAAEQHTPPTSQVNETPIAAPTPDASTAEDTPSPEDQIGVARKNDDGSVEISLH